MQARFAAEHDRVARAGAQRLLEDLGAQLVDREHRAELRVRAGEPVHVLEAHRADEAGPEDRDERTPRREVLDELFDGGELRRARELDAEPHAERVLRLDDCDIEAGGGLETAIDRGVGLHLDDQGALLAAGVFVLPAVLVELAGGSSTR